MENNYVYPAYLKEEDGDKYLVFPDFEELVVGIEDDIDFIQEAQTELALVIIGYLDEGRELPKRSEFDKDAIYIHVWLPYFRNMTKEEDEMKNNDIFDFIGETAPFGDEIGIVNEMSNDCKCEKGYRRFCKECKKGTPESMKGFIDENACEEDEIYYCFWCDFIQSTGIDESIVSQQRDAAQAMKHNDYDMEDDGSNAMWELEEAGAFSDEGIMPGCHSRDWEYEMEAREIAKEFEDMEFVGSLLKNAREKIQLSVEEMARRLKVPETFINDIESGQYINRHGDADFISDIPVAVSGPVSAVSADKHEVKREWWHGCSDLEITEKIADYLSYVIAPPVDKKHAPDTFEQGLIKNGFVDSAQSILKNNIMTMGLIQRAFKIGARAAYQIMDILFAAGVVKEFPQKDATTTLDLDEETIGVFESAGWSKEDIASLKVSKNLLDLYNKIEALNKKYDV